MVSGNSKRKFDEFDPNRSDSDDEDYDNAAPKSSQQRSRGRSKPSRKSQNARKKQVKRKRTAYGDSDDDIEDDEDDISEEEDSFSEESEVEDKPINPATGRRQRTAAAKAATYLEESDEEVLETDDESRPASPQKRNTVVPESLVVKLHISPAKMRRVTRRSGRTSDPPLPAAATGTRRSSRVSRQSEEPLMALADSGEQSRVVSGGSRPPSEEPRTRTAKGGKSIKSLPSAIVETSHETTADVDSGNFFSELQEHAAEAGDDVEPKADPTNNAEDEEMLLTTDVVPQSDVEADADAAGDEDEDEDDVPRKPSRSLRARGKPDSPKAGRRSLRPRKSAVDQSSDFEPEGEEEVDEDAMLSADEKKKPKSAEETSDSAAGTRRSGRLRPRRGESQRQSAQEESAGSEIDLDEVAEEAEELADDRRRNKRPRRGRRGSPISFEPNLRNRSNRPDYRVFRPELLAAMDDEDNAPPISSQQRNNRRVAAPTRTLFSTFGPFGGAGGPLPVFGGPDGVAAAGGVDSDSSDDDVQIPSKRRGTIGGMAGMTPGGAPMGLMPQSHNADSNQAGGGPANFGKVKDRKALADADPLGIDPNVNFDGVGGLENHINQLKEMVALPLLYPEVFMSMHITPPRGVLFHGPPGTGKTLLARALASSVSTPGKKVTFYMRKGADALSKWVGEAERQLRMLFEEARKNQPSIIFFDEIDGLAPVRSSKQEQIHASIVATLLALMDGMDGRGQVIVIGATNRPDSVDPALRRPGRFDREFYFPLPNKDGRRKIIDIHTKGWEPPLQPHFKNQLAEITKGYGGADLRALCTEAALNAVQGTFPQIYSSDKKLLIDPAKIKVMAKDFMISVNKMVPSSERSASTGAAALKKSIEPLLRKPLAEISEQLNEIIPQKKKATALEEAMYDDRDDEFGFEKETMQREFETARVFRPRLLIRGMQGMGQQYIGAALLSKFEGLHVSSFDLSTLLKDSSRSAEAAVVQLFEEVKRHKPSVIYIPNVDVWYRTLQEPVIRTFTGLLRSLNPTDPVLLLGVLEASSPEEQPDQNMMRDLFGYSAKGTYVLKGPDQSAREEYFADIIEHIKRSPASFPGENRKKRVLEELPEAPIAQEAPKGPTKDDLKEQKRKDRYTLNMLKLLIQRVMDQIKLKYRKFRTPPIDEREIGYLFDERDPEMLATDLADDHAREHMHRPYKLDTDEKGITGLREIATGKFYYNLEIVTIEKRLSNGYYKRARDFEADIRKLAKDAKMTEDPERILKANEMLANVEVDMTELETNNPVLAAECEAVYQREQSREKERVKKMKEAEGRGEDVPNVESNVPPQASHTTSEQTSGPVHLGVEVPAPRSLPPVTPIRLWDNQSNGYSLSNGTHPQSNGSTVPSKANDGDFEMANSQNTSGMVNPQEQFGFQSHHHAVTPGENTQTQRSQHSSVMQLHPGSQAADYHNSASTTTSGQKTSDHSNRSSNHTRLSNGTTANGEAPDFDAVAPSGGSQFPETQEHPDAAIASQHLSSQGFSQPSQPMAPPPPRAPELEVEPASPPPVLIAPDPNILDGLKKNLVQSSSGFSVEQLEQIRAALMRAVWKTRGEWNRGVAMRAVTEAYNEMCKDIETMQRVLGPSQEGED